MRRALLCCLFACLAPLPAAAFDLGDLMRHLVAHPGGRARFVETKYLAVLDQPLVARGEMTYTPPGRLEKRTLSPKQETLLLEGNRLSLQRDRQTLSIDLASQPQALAFIDSIRGILAGNRQALEQNYSLHLAGRLDQWTLTLLPRDMKIAELVLRITVQGSRGQLRSIDYLQADGDRTELRIEPSGGQ